MAVDIRRFYEEHVGILSKEQQMLLIAVTADVRKIEDEMINTCITRL